MDFFRTACAKKADYFAGRRAAHDTVVDEYKTFALYVAAKRVEFDFDGTLAHRLAGLNESPADVSVFGESVHHRQTADVGVSACADGRAVGHARYDVGVYLVKFGKFLSAIIASLVYADSVDYGIASCEVDVLEHAGVHIGHGVFVRLDFAVGSDDNHFARFHVAYELRVHGVERATFACKNDCAVLLAHNEGLESVTVANGDEFVVRHTHDCERADEIEGGFLHAVFNARRGVIIYERRDDLAVHRGLENVPSLDEPFFYGSGVDDVAVVGNCHSAVPAVKHDGLSVDDVAGPAGGITHVTDCNVRVGQKRKFLVGENLVDETHIFVVSDTALGNVDGNARALLPSVLEGEQSVIHFPRERGFVLLDNAENAALLVHAAVFTT